MNYKDKGDIPISECDEANIPVNCFMNEPDEDFDTWTWTADNFMPRKGRIEEGQYRIEAELKSDLLDAVNKYVTPLYEAALKNLQLTGDNYYWETRSV